MIKASFPEEFLKFFASKDVFQTEAKIMLAIQLYSEKKIPIGKAAELCEMNYYDFEKELKKKDILKIIGPIGIDDQIKEYENLKKFTKK